LGQVRDGVGGRLRWAALLSLLLLLAPPLMRPAQILCCMRV